MRYSVFCLLLSQAVRRTLGYNFKWEAVQLSDADAGSNPDFAFGDKRAAIQYSNETGCKTFPGDAAWPSTAQWAALDDAVGGALIKGTPPAAACYQGPDFNKARCDYVKTNGAMASFAMADPGSTLQPWQMGDLCPIPPANQANLTCGFGAYPSYILNATTVKQIQLAVNFARNNNIRLVIKNSGHDFLGRAVGAGSLSIWTHYLKDSEYIPSYQLGEYDGGALRVGAALQAYDFFTLMNKHNVTLVTPGGAGVGSVGGYLQGGGHSLIGSYHGMMSDQILSIEVVTADGRFVHASPQENKSLFWALRGGGGSTFGVITSAIMKAHPAVPMSSSSITFSLNSIPAGNVTEIFWQGIGVYFAHVNRICDAKGTGYNYITPGGSGSSRTLDFRTLIWMPEKSADQATEFIAPLIADLNDVGINISNPKPTFYRSYGAQNTYMGISGGVGNSRFSSRLFPRENFEDPSSELFEDTIQAVRDFVDEGNYLFHSVNFAATRKVAGYPGVDSALNPAVRNSVAHATGFDSSSYSGSVESQIANHQRLDSFIQRWRDVTPTSGAYVNEADVLEPDFARTFWGTNYGRLLAIKKETDPWSLFYAAAGVGSDEWEVQGTQGLPLQTGRLCKVA